MFGDSSSGVVTDTAISKTLVFVTTDHFGKTKQCDRKAIKKRAANGRGRPKRILASSKPRAGTWLKHDADTKVHVMITEIIYPSPSMFPGISAPTMTKVYTGTVHLSCQAKETDRQSLCTTITSILSAELLLNLPNSR